MLASSPDVQSCFARQWTRYALNRWDTSADLASVQGGRQGLPGLGQHARSHRRGGDVANLPLSGAGRRGGAAMTIRTSKTQLKFSRRATLKALGLGAGFLPLLSTERARGATAATGFPKRLITVAVTDGICPPNFYTSAGGALPATLPSTLQPLARLELEAAAVAAGEQSGQPDRLQRGDGRRRQVRRPLHLPRAADRRGDVAERNATRFPPSRRRSRRSISCTRPGWRRTRASTTRC